MSDANASAIEDLSARGRRRFGTRGRLVAAAIILAIAAALGWWKFHSTALQDRRLQKTESVAQCINAIRDSIDRSLRASGSSETASKKISAGARFSDVNGNPEPLSFDNHGVPAELGRDRSSVFTNWQIGGRVSIDGSLPFGSALASDTRFGCSVIVFDDNTIHVAGKQVVRA